MILVTGAAGRIGRVVTQYLRAHGHKVRATDIVAAPGVDHVSDLGDGQSAAALLDGISAVLHFAGHPNSRDWAVLQRVNINAMQYLADAAGTAGVARFVFASSVHASGLEPAGTRLHAGLPISADSPYGVSKVMGEALLHHACYRHGMSGVALRICAFRTEPSDARELRLWLSPNDMSALALASVTARFEGVETIWGISANRRAEVDRAAWARLGYVPADEAEDHLERLVAAGVDIELVSEWPLLGGQVAAATLGERNA